jgi:hypothetical protein
MILSSFMVFNKVIFGEVSVSQNKAALLQIRKCHVKLCARSLKQWKNKLPSQMWMPKCKLKKKTSESLVMHFISDFNNDDKKLTDHCFTKVETQTKSHRKTKSSNKNCYFYISEMFLQLIITTKHFGKTHLPNNFQKVAN